MSVGAVVLTPTLSLVQGILLFLVLLLPAYGMWMFRIALPHKPDYSSWTQPRASAADIGQDIDKRYLLFCFAMFLFATVTMIWNSLHS
jgi:hypothetical protein